MAKTIKFNLILDNVPVRDIDGLRENFSIEDILSYYSNKILHRWLEVRGYHEELAEVNAIPVNSDTYTIISSLIQIFRIEADPNKIREGISILTYLVEHRICNLEYAQNQADRKTVIEDYHAGYDILIEHMLANKNDMSVLKADAREIEENYYELFKLDCRRLYFYLSTRARKAIFALLTRPCFRKHWIEDTAVTEVRNDIRSNLTELNLMKSLLADDIVIEKRNTEGMWDPIVPKGNTVMVLYIASSSFIKNSGNFSEKLAHTDVNNNLLLLDGLEFQCNSYPKDVIYMEV